MRILKITKSSVPLAALAVLLLCAQTSRAIDLEGVQPIAFDQPQVSMLLQPEAGGDPFSVDLFGDEVFNISAFLDTGSSGIVIDPRTADPLGVPRAEFGGVPVKFNDVAIGGSTEFAVSQPVRMRISGTNSFDIDNINTFETVYNQAYGPLNLQIGPTNGTPSEILVLDIVGMPAMIGKTVVMDPKPVNVINPINTYIYDQGTPFNPAAATTNPGIPETSHHVQLSYGDFERFTQTTPLGAAPATLNHNPFVGPDPLLPLTGGSNDGQPPPISLSFGGQQTSGSFLLDTGSIASFMSTDLAADLNVRYRPGNEFGTEEPVLETFDPSNPGAEGTAIENQFFLPILGISGEVTVAGFFLDDMLLQTMEGSADPDDPNNIRYVGAPVLIIDIELQDPDTLQTITLDGVFGMNNMVASAFFTVEGGIGDTAIGAYDWVTFDEPNGILGLDLGSIVPEPSSYLLAASGLLGFAAFAWRRRRRRQSGGFRP